MNDERYCCDGKCEQGRDCPRYKSNTEVAAVFLVKLVAVVVFASVCAGYLWASFGS